MWNFRWLLLLFALPLLAEEARWICYHQNPSWEGTAGPSWTRIHVQGGLPFLNLGFPIEPKGYLWGVAALTRSRAPRAAYGEFSGWWYKGRLEEPSTNRLRIIHYYLQARAGYNFAGSNDMFIFTPYVGLAARSVQEELLVDFELFGPFDLAFSYYSYEIPMGAMGSLHLNPYLEIALDCSYSPQIATYLKVRQFSACTTIHSRHSVLIRAPLTLVLPVCRPSWLWRIAWEVECSIEPFYRYVKLGAASVAILGVPVVAERRQQSYGVNLLFGVRF